MIVRRATAVDIPALLELDRQSPFAAHWSQEQYRTLFAEAAVPSTGRFVLVAEASEQQLELHATDPPPSTSKIVAYLVANKVDTEWELENIVVAEKSRRQGLASRLLRDFAEHVQQANGSFIFLEVRELNHAARRLYKQFGFVATGIRKNYYSNPPGDAIVYRRVVKKFS